MEWCRYHQQQEELHPKRMCVFPLNMNCIATCLLELVITSLIKACLPHQPYQQQKSVLAILFVQKVIFCSTNAVCSTNVCSEKLFVPYRKMCVREMIVQQFCLFKNVFAPTTICSNNVLRVSRVARKVWRVTNNPWSWGMQV